MLDPINFLIFCFGTCFGFSLFLPAWAIKKAREEREEKIRKLDHDLYKVTLRTERLMSASDRADAEIADLRKSVGELKKAQTVDKPKEART